MRVSSGLTAKAAWIPRFGIFYSVGIDGLSLFLVLLTTLLMPLCVLGSWNYITQRERGYYAMLHAALRHWIETAFPFTKAYYSNAEIPALPPEPSLRYRSAVHAAYRAHVRSLLAEAGVPDPDYLADALLAALEPELILHQLDRGMALEQCKRGWESLVATVRS